MPDLADVTPNGCRHCGIPQRPHAQQYTPAAGWHGWEPPTQQQRLERMKARTESQGGR